MTVFPCHDVQFQRPEHYVLVLFRQLLFSSIYVYIHVSVYIMFMLMCALCSPQCVHYVHDSVCIMFITVCALCSSQCALCLWHSVHYVYDIVCIMFITVCALCSWQCVHYVHGSVCIMCHSLTVLWIRYRCWAQDAWGNICTVQKKIIIHQVTTMPAISKNVLFPGHTHLLTTSTDDPTLWLSPERQLGI